MLTEAFFVSARVHEREVKLPDGSVHKLHFKELAAADFNRYAIATRSTNEEVQAQAACRLIAMSLCEPDGRLALTYEQATRLRPDAFTALSAAVADVNKREGDAGKASPPETSDGSGTS